MTIILENLTDEERKPTSAVKQIQERAQRKVIILTTAPQTSNAILSEGDMGFIESTGKLYLRLKGKAYEVTLTENA